MRGVLATCIAVLVSLAVAQPGSTAGPYRVVKSAKVGGTGGYDYVYADVVGRRLYVARTGQTPRMTVYNLDTFEPVGEIPGTKSHGAVVDSKSNHGFISSKPILMFDSKTLMPIKTISVQGNPDGMLFDPVDQRTYILSHVAPHVTAINAKDGSVLGTIDIGGMPEQAASDGRGHVYVDVEDKANIAVIDTRTLTVAAHYNLAGKAGTCAGLALDAKNHILFSSCRNPASMVILNADDGTIITTLPIGAGTDGADFNPNTLEAFSSQRDGTLTIIREESRTNFIEEQTVQTMTGARTSTLDTKTNRIILIAAEFRPPTQPQPGGNAGRGQIVPDSFTILAVGK
jgi:DNA-binding beta-propeller fold protein YncE